MCNEHYSVLIKIPFLKNYYILTIIIIHKYHQSFYNYCNKNIIKNLQQIVYLIFDYVN